MLIVYYNDVLKITHNYLENTHSVTKEIIETKKLIKRAVATFTQDSSLIQGRISSLSIESLTNKQESTILDELKIVNEKILDTINKSEKSETGTGLYKKVISHTLKKLINSTFGKNE